MAVNSDLFYNVLNPGSAVDIRPPLGEMWKVTYWDQGGYEGATAPYTYYPNMTGATAAFPTPNANNGQIISDPTTFAPTWIGNAGWVRIVNNTGSTSTYNFCVAVEKYLYADVTVRQVIFNSTAGTAATVELRPPLGKIWVVKQGVFPKVSSATTTPAGNVGYRTATTTYAKSCPWNGAIDTRLFMVLTNSQWGVIAQNSTYTGFGWLIYAELDDTAFALVGGTVASTAGYTDIRPPLGEQWQIGVCTGTTTNLAMYPYDGTTRSSLPAPGYRNTTPRMTLSNAKWAQIYSMGSTYTAAYSGIKHPLT